MIKYLLIPLLIFTPFLYAQTYEDAAGTSQMLADSIKGYWDFIFSDVPNLIQRAWAFLLEYVIKIKLYLTFQLMQFSWGIAKALIENLQIMSQITANINALPQDARQAIIDMRLIDAINLVLNAYVTRYVMRIV